MATDARFIILNELLQFYCKKPAISNNSSEMYDYYHMNEAVLRVKDIVLNVSDIKILLDNSSALTNKVPYMLKIMPGHLFPSVTSGLGVYLNQGVYLRQAFIIFVTSHPSQINYYSYTW